MNRESRNLYRIKPKISTKITFELPSFAKAKKSKEVT